MLNDNLIRELKQCGEALIKIAEAINEGDVKYKAPATKDKPDSPTFEEIRGALALKIQQGYSEKVRALLVKYGGTKLSDIDASNYVPLMNDVEGIE